MRSAAVVWCAFCKQPVAFFKDSLSALYRVGEKGKVKGDEIKNENPVSYYEQLID